MGYNISKKLTNTLPWAKESQLFWIALPQPQSPKNYWTIMTRADHFKAYKFLHANVDKSEITFSDCTSFIRGGLYLYMLICLTQYFCCK